MLLWKLRRYKYILWCNERVLNEYSGSNYPYWFHSHICTESEHIDALLDALLYSARPSYLHSFVDCSPLSTITSSQIELSTKLVPLRPLVGKVRPIHLEEFRRGTLLPQTFTTSLSGYFELSKFLRYHNSSYRYDIAVSPSSYSSSLRSWKHVSVEIYRSPSDKMKWTNYSRSIECFLYLPSRLFNNPCKYCWSSFSVPSSFQYSI